MKLSKQFGMAVFGLFMTGLGLCLLSAQARAADTVYVCDPAFPANCSKPDASGNLPVTGSFSASLSGFTPSGTVASLSVTAASANVALPAGTVVAITNTGTTNTAFIKLSVGASTAAVTDMALVPGATVGLTVGSNTFINAITSSSTTTLRLAGGSGLVSGFGGGGGGSGGSSAAVGATGAAVPGSADYSGMNVGGNLTGMTGTANGLKVDGSAVTQPVSGTITASQGTAANLNATVVGTGTFAAQLTGATNNINNVSGTVSLPTGASTSALQPTNAAAGSTTSGQTGNVVLCAVTTSAPTYTNGQSNFCNMDTSGAIRVSATGSGGTSVAQGSTTSGQNVSPAGCATVSSSPTNTNAQTNMMTCDTAGLLKVNVVAGGGTGGTSVAQGSTTSGQNVSPMGCRTLTSAPTDTTGQTNMPSCDTAGAIRVNVTSATGVAQGSTTSGQSISPIGCRTLTSAPTDTTAQTNIPWCTTKGSQVVAQPTAADLNVTAALASGSAVQPVPGTTGGLSIFYLTAANSTNATNVKASAGTLYDVELSNNSATLAYVSFYNTAGTPTCGTSIVGQAMIPANSTSGAGWVSNSGLGKAFSTGIGICVTTGIAGTGSVAASAYTITLGYK